MTNFSKRKLPIALCVSVCAVALAGCPCVPLFLSMTIVEGGDVAPPGKTVTGPHDFMGTLVPQDTEPATWAFDGSFVFPTSGFTVGDVEAQVAESFPEQVTIIVPVTPPPKGSVLLPMLTEVPVNATIQVSEQALFTAFVREECPEFALSFGR